MLRLSPSKTRDIIEGELLSALTTLKDGAPFLAPVGLAPQKKQLLPTAALKHDALRASDKVFRQYLRNLLHSTPPTLYNPHRVALTVIIAMSSKHEQAP